MMHAPLRSLLAFLCLVFLLSNCSQNEQTDHAPAPGPNETMAAAAEPAAVAVEVAEVSIDTPQPPPVCVVLKKREQGFEKDIQLFEKMERENPSPKGGIVFTGSSSIRKWETLTADMAPLPVVNRGFGGSTLRQVDAYAARILFPLEPKVLVVYCGENDIANDKFPAESALQDFEHLVSLVNHHLPKTHIVFISMKPSPARWRYWPKFDEGNALIELFCTNHENLTYVDVGRAMMAKDGEPDPDIFVSDKLHMNPEGYQIWKKIIRPVVKELYQ